jgi:acyl carrier protein
MSLRDRVAAVFDEIFGVGPDLFAIDLAPESVPNWDSIGHMNMVMELEKQFGQQFEVDEIMEMSSPGKVMEILRSKGVPD